MALQTYSPIRDTYHDFISRGEGEKQTYLQAYRGPTKGQGGERGFAKAAATATAAGLASCNSTVPQNVACLMCVLLGDLDENWDGDRQHDHDAASKHEPQLLPVLRSAFLATQTLLPFPSAWFQSFLTLLSDRC